MAPANAAVLNAFRHQISVHNGDGALQGIVFECSTPFGIRYRFTLPASTRDCGSRRAQRLSASDIGSQDHHRSEGHDLLVLNAFRHQISVDRVKVDIAEHREVVLNAFRHQISVHSVRWHPCTRTDCAQRLSASDIGSPARDQLRVEPNEGLNAFRHQISVHPFHGSSSQCHCVCAQRLSASDIGSLRPCRPLNRNRKISGLASI